MPKPRILCLPGFGTNKKIMNYQLRLFMREIPEFEYVITDPFFELDKALLPHVHPNLVKLLENEKLYSWMSFRQPFGEDAAVSLKNLVDFMNETGPYVGMLGFSQGGRMIHYFISEHQKAKIKYKFEFPKFFIFICGFVSFEFQEKSLPSFNTYDCKSVHILCKNDILFIPSLFMSLKYSNPLALFFNQTHKIPYIDKENYEKIKKYIAESFKEKKKRRRIESRL